MHVHRNEDEWYYLLDGDGDLSRRRGDLSRPSRGRSCSSPRGAAHLHDREPDRPDAVAQRARRVRAHVRAAPSTPEEAVPRSPATTSRSWARHPRQAADVTGAERGRERAVRGEVPIRVERAGSRPWRGAKASGRPGQRRAAPAARRAGAVRAERGLDRARDHGPQARRPAARVHPAAPSGRQSKTR